MGVWEEVWPWVCVGEVWRGGRCGYGCVGEGVAMGVWVRCGYGCGGGVAMGVWGRCGYGCVGEGHLNDCCFYP